MPLSTTWTYPTSIRFGAGRIAELAAAVAEAGITRPLFVTDRNLAALPMTTRTLAALAASGTELFCDIKPNPVEANITAGDARLPAGGRSEAGGLAPRRGRRVGAI